MIKQMSIKEYHGADGLSKSMMDYLKKSPAHLHYEMQLDEEKSNDNFIMGSLLHTLLLEPNKFDENYIIMPAIDRRTKQGKEMYEEFLENCGERQIISQEQYDLANIWADRILQHPKAKEYFPKKSINEVSIFWTDKKTGELCKARPDKIILEDDCIVDLKTAVSAQQDDFQRKAFDLGYHRQAYWFAEAYKQEYGRELKDFIFITVEKTPPYNVVVYVASEFFIEIGGIECRELLNKYHECKQLGNWYGYDGMQQDIQMLELPNYVITKYMEEI